MWIGMWMWMVWWVEVDVGCGWYGVDWMDGLYWMWMVWWVEVLRGIMWRKCVDEDMRSMGIKVCVAQDRCAWRNAIRGPTRASADALHLTLVV